MNSADPPGNAIDAEAVNVVSELLYERGGIGDEYACDELASRIVAAAAPVIAAQAARDERQAIAANIEAEAEIGSWTWQGREALRSFARRLYETGDKQ